MCIGNETERYFVQVLLDDNGLYNRTMTSSEIIERIDMKDCSGQEIAVFMTTEFGKIEQLKVLGCWHNLDDPLLIELVDKNNKVIISGYGTDH